jgi:NAD(P)-dependent dehydrogenase (short-subunit alcohol dehydrogenase family)
VAERPLEGQVAIVTGGARGLGHATAARLERDGACVAVFDLDGEVPVDVTDETQVREAVSAVLAEHGRVDILVNNVGVYPHRPFEELTFEEWRRVLATNLDSVFLCTHAVFPAMRERRYGRIVNVSSATFLIGFPEMTAYIASKGAIIGFTRSLAHEAGEHGITINAIAPGLIATESVVGGEEAELLDIYVREQSIHRNGQPEDIAECVAYLVSPAAGFITGQTVNVDGGHRFL